ncbi:MAG: radical SAM protein [Gammaproteobacteria bacterium]|nr:radical SAM protein [Gammaproteobacteria bacterium]
MGIVGAHTAQFPRAAALVRQFRAAEIPVIIGGSHVSGTLRSLPEPARELQEMLDLGVSLFIGEAEGHFEEVLRDAHARRMKPIYDYGEVMVDMEQALLPTHVPLNVERRLALGLNPVNPIEAGRGCPYKCSFCTVVNVHGREARARTPEAVACFVRASIHHGRSRFMFTDDNFARNENWKPILEALLALREKEGLKFSFILQVDTQSDRIPGFIELAARAGCVQIFVGMESINTDALRTVSKNQNSVKRYQRFFLAWKRHGVVIMAGYIVGFPTDTPESVRRDLATIKRELPLDLLYLFILTPLPGSADHTALVEQGAPLDSDPSRYTTFHTTIPHPHMSGAELEALYYEAWRIYYDDAHSATILRRHAAMGGHLDDLTPFLLVARNAFAVDNVNPAEVGILRRQMWRERRPDLPRESLIPFLLRRGWSTAMAQGRWLWDIHRVTRMVRQVERERSRPMVDDLALQGLDAR